MIRPQQALLLLALIVSGCPKDEPAPPPQVSAPTPDETAPEPTTLALAEGWSEIPPDDPVAEAPMAKARAATKALGKKLKGQLVAAVEGGDFARGIEVCASVAGPMAASVSESRGLDVGRTSFRVRNPDNRPTPVMQPVVDARLEREILMKGPSGELLYMAPIRMAEVCTRCHGAAAEIAPEVKAALAERYPDDEAVGFAAGELRGWFHAQLTPPASGDAPE